MKVRALKYLLAYSLPLGVSLSFTREGWLTIMPVVYAFVFIPFIELFIKASDANLNQAEREFAKKDRIYDWMLYGIVPIQVGFVIWYLFNIQDVAITTVTFWGRSMSLGLMCGVLGINVAHELGHRAKSMEKAMAKILLMTAMYPHFYIEHNYGHHRNVATPGDPASARYNEVLYIFWLRSIVYSYLSAWEIENKRTKRKEGSRFSWKNEMLRFTFIELFILLLILLVFGWKVLLGFMAAASMGVLLLETVNYIEHYGLTRKKVSETRYENANPAHSWNSNHWVGRLMLFELSRHSDHHANPVKKYQVLESYDGSPQMPTGYPGMMFLSMIPPLWFWIMNKRVRQFNN